MDNLLTIALEAKNDDRNHRRSYRITIGQDLLSDWTVRICYGRIGQRGQEKHFGGSNADAMRRVVREHLRRRLSAKKRIGCSYRVTQLSTAMGFDASSWLPGELMAKFFCTNLTLSRFRVTIPREGGEFVLREHRSY
jgi:predicted DNA-binding WGR domain protein